MYPVVANSPASRRVRSPSWLDLRLVAGVVLVLVSVLVGVRVVSAADRTTHFWAASHNLAAGVVVTASDLRSVAVRMPSGSANYLSSSVAVTGSALNRAIGAGELIPKSALGAVTAAITVTIPLGGDNAPKISAGQRITVWVSTALCRSATVIDEVTVQGVQTARAGTLDASGGEDVIVRVSPQLADRVIQALSLDGGVLRAGIVEGAASADPGPTDLATCVASGS
jgi:hypothetical protein